MQKKEVIEFFGSVDAVAKLVGSTSGAVSQWPDTLSYRVQDRILGACMRNQIEPPNHWVQLQTNEQSA